MALLAHEIGHNRFWHLPIAFFLLTSLLYLLRPYAPWGILFSLAATRTLGIRFEFSADRYASKLVSKEALASALKKIEKPLPGSIEAIPMLNLFLTHSSIEERLDALTELNERSPNDSTKEKHETKAHHILL